MRFIHSARIFHAQILALRAAAAVSFKKAGQSFKAKR
jgi:hypothetical protein